MTILNKIKWVLGILMIFVLIIATNLIDRNNFLRVKDSVITIYEDRLVVNDIIFEFAQYVQEKEIAMISLDSAFYGKRNNEINDKIQNLIIRYEETKLTKEEDKVFSNFKENLEDLETQEVTFVQSDFSEKESLQSIIDEVQENLHDLSKIQLSEGGRQMNISKKAVDAVELFTRLEIYVLIFLAVLVQIIILYNPKKSS
ncbi:MCP four helix bundle domain-containing protein [Maribacter litopenaei]|uniref:MCP four helix bundle domain-containing protein n=1 Tax=Maribacter litopenaei TaxID=2976127 RepID=A0ABY5YDZ0_9FLAO|nr:MCP four helix bundle domain-containing protein [Maribacter litopenaei]UWX56330.1 MCP four helix bundle domain-containing protein [Maribacter litopenaei]